jgi:hypothetical protein
VEGESGWKVWGESRVGMEGMGQDEGVRGKALSWHHGFLVVEVACS